MLSLALLAACSSSPCAARGGISWSLCVNCRGGSAACLPLALPCVVGSTSRHTLQGRCRRVPLVPAAYDSLGDSLRCLARMVRWGWPTGLSPLVVAQFMAQFNALLRSYDDYLDPRLVAHWLLQLVVTSWASRSERGLQRLTVIIRLCRLSFSLGDRWPLRPLRRPCPKKKKRPQSCSSLC